MNKYLYSDIVSYDDITYIDKVGYASSATFNGLLAIENNEAKIVCTFPGERISKITLHHKQYFYNNKIFFMPDHAKSIHIYDLSDKTMRMVQFGNIKGYEDPVRGCDSYLLHDKVYVFFEYKNNPVLVFDLKSERIIDMFSLSIPSDLGVDNSPIINTPLSKMGDFFYAATWGRNCILKICVENKKNEIIRVDSLRNRRLSQVCAVGNDKFYITTPEGEIGYCYSNGKNEWNVDWVNSIESKNETFCNIIYYHGNPYLIPNGRSNGSGFYKIEGNKVRKITLFPDEYDMCDDKRKTWRSYFSWTIKKDILTLCPYRANMRLSLDLTNNTVNSSVVRLSKEDYRKVYMDILGDNLKKGIVHENEKEDLKCFLEYLSYEEL